MLGAAHPLVADLFDWLEAVRTLGHGLLAESFSVAVSDRP